MGMKKERRQLITDVVIAAAVGCVIGTLLATWVAHMLGL